MKYGIEPEKVIMLKEWGNGENHFVSMLKCGDTISYYYDSFGRKPPEPFLKLKNKQVYYNTFQEQEDDEVNCGPRAVLSIKKFKSFKL